MVCFLLFLPNYELGCTVLDLLESAFFFLLFSKHELGCTVLDLLEEE